MRVAVVKATINRDTGEVLKREVVDHIEMDEDEYYRPLVEILAKDAEKLIQKEQESQAG